MRSFLCAVVVIGLGLAVNPKTEGAEPGRYPVRPVRPASVGQKHRLGLSYARSMQLQITGIPWPREIQVDQTVDLSALAEVLAVNEYGNPTKVRLVVEKGSFLKGDRLKVKDDLEPGEVLTFEFRKDDGFVVTREQGEFKKHVARMFAEALPYSRWALTDRRHQRYFDGDGQPPRKAGESWEMDGAFLASLTPRSINLDKSRMTGTMSLEGLVRLGGRPCMKLGARMRLPKYTAEDGSLWMVDPKDIEFTDGTFDGQVTCWVPLDATRQPIKWTETWRATVTGRPKPRIGGRIGQAVAAVHTTRTIEVADLGSE